MSTLFVADIPRNMLITAAGGDSARLGLDQRELPSHPKIFPPLLRVSWASFLFGQVAITRVPLRPLLRNPSPIFPS